MEKGEPTLVPEWLKNAGSLSSSGTISHSDEHSTSKLARNKSFVNSNGHDFGRSSGSDRTTSSYFRRSSSNNGSAHLRSYNSFGRNVHDREWEKDTYDSRDKDKSILGDRRHRGFSDSLGNTSSSKFERDGLRRSQSAISEKHGDTWTKKAVSDSNNAGGNNINLLLTKGVNVGGVNKATFERNFPSLGAEERAAVPEIGRVPSPGLSSAIQSLPIGTSAMIGGEKWTSALAEVPELAGSNGIGISSVQQTASTPMALGLTTSLNMAEAVAQGPNRAPVTPQLSAGTHRLEELAIKQSRQLIPVTPSMPKTLVLNSSDKQKTKVSQQHPVSSLPINHSPRGGPGKGDISKASNVGKLHVLKPVREKNGVAPIVKDNLSPTNGSKVVSSMLAAAPPSVSGSAAVRAPPNNPVPDRKPVLTVLEKRTTSQAQSRNEFFNLVRKKSLANSSPVADLDVENSSSTVTDKLSEKEVEPSPDTTHIQLSASLSGDLLSEKTEDSTCIDNTCDAQKYCSNEKNRSCFDPVFSEEEAAFLRSMGWEENSDEGLLTEEEISAFIKVFTKYINSKPALKILQGVQPRFLLPFDSQMGGFSSGLSSSDAKLES